ncbi:protein LNK2-like isoform X2 [Papaver somniferum]|uniref:protein LNK2-like isoform X2 n=1 Tax=Papaver somniferum TaxID=3469 RepID=UPI000E6FF44D|nr:protein LNK2-like isoform X2 [Papaver somniferum]
MFDWNEEEELTRVVWGEASENSDHIVPYANEGDAKPSIQCGTQRKKQRSNEDSPDKHVEQNKPGDCRDSSGSKLEGSSQFNTDGLTDLEMDWPNSPLPIAACDTGGLDNGTRLFANEHEENEHVGFLDYSWDNNGTFDDLDKILRDDDPIYGHETLGDAAELWSSSADVLSSPNNCFPTPASSQNMDIGASMNTFEECKVKVRHPEDTDFPCGGEKTSDSVTRLLKDVDPRKDKSTGPGSKFLIPAVEKTDTKMVERMLSDSTGETSATRNEVSSKVTGQREPLTRPKTGNGREIKCQNVCGAWPLNGNKFQQIGNQFQMSSFQTFPRAVPGLPQPFMYVQTSHPYMPTGHGNSTNYYVPMLPHVSSERGNDHSALHGYRFPQVVSTKMASPSKKLPGVLLRQTTMTPQEKMEKLRRRQQLQAVLAIQGQQQQLGPQFTCADSDTQRCIQANRSQDTGGKIELVGSFESDWPIQQDDSIAMIADDCSLKQQVLDQLQDVIGKLDMSTRFRIRDSLFRLAQSAIQRHSSEDTGSTSSFMVEDEFVVKKEIEGANRSTNVPEAENETNPIDRTVAHLLFRKPLRSSSTLSVSSTDKQIASKPCNVSHFQSNTCKTKLENISNNEDEGGKVGVDAALQKRNASDYNI